MLARCARCQGTFQTDRFGVQTCPNCGGEVLLSDPNAGRAATGAPPPPPSVPPEPAAPGPATPAEGAPPSAAAPPTWSGPPGGELPPPPPPPPGGYGQPPPGFGGPTGPRPEGPELAAPFADRARLGFFRAYFESWKLAAVEPATFFRRVRIDQTGTAVLFGVIASTVGGWAQVFWAAITAASTRAQMAEAFEKVPPGAEDFAQKLRELMELMTSTPVLVGQAILAPLAAVIGIFLSAAIFHALLLLVRGAHRGFDATLTVVGYAMGLSLLQAIPQCGAVVWPFWYLVVLVIGLGEAHRCGPGKGAAAVLLPLLLACLCACAIGIAVASAAGLGAATGQVPQGVGL